MPISPIDIFRAPQVDGVAAILSSGQSVLTNALNQAIQTGRDSVNLRANQEKEVLAERERLDNLNQRKAEFATRTNQLDTQFLNDVLTNDRNFQESKRRDQRDFKFKVQTDARDYRLQQKTALNNILNSDRAASLNQERVDLAKAEKTKEKTFLQDRANGILGAAEGPSLFQKIFGGGRQPLPEDKIALGTELKKIGEGLQDPTLMSKGDQILSEGTGGLIQRRADAKPAPKSAKAPKTPEQRIVELTQIIKAYENLQTDPEADALTNTDRVKLNRAKIELEDLLKTHAGKSGSKPVEPNTDPLLNTLNPPRPGDNTP